MVVVLFSVIQTFVLTGGGPANAGLLVLLAHGIEPTAAVEKNGTSAARKRR